MFNTLLAYKQKFLNSPLAHVVLHSTIYAAVVILTITVFSCAVVNEIMIGVVAAFVASYLSSRVMTLITY